MTSACVAFLPESDVVEGMQLGAARLRYRRGWDRQATEAASCCSGWQRRRRSMRSSMLHQCYM